MRQWMLRPRHVYFCLLENRHQTISLILIEEENLLVKLQEDKIVVIIVNDLHL